MSYESEMIPFKRRQYLEVALRGRATPSHGIAYPSMLISFSFVVSNIAIVCFANSGKMDTQTGFYGRSALCMYMCM